MDTSKDSGVSPVIATVLLIALSVVLIALVAAVVMASISSFTPVENKVVGFTVEVNATNNTALITPVAGNDLPFLTSYRVYTNNGHWDSPDAQGIRVPDFNSTVTYVNIVGNFTDHITALVFSGKVVIEGGVIIVTPVVNPYYVVGSDGYNTTSEFVDSFNTWYNKYYDTGLNPGDPGYEVVTVDINDKDFTFSNLNPIIVGNQPIEFSQSNVHDLSYGNVKILIDEGGNIVRAPGYYDALLEIGNISDPGTTEVTIEKKQGDPFTLNGSNIDGVTSPLITISSQGRLVVQKDATLVVENNQNLYGDGFGGGIFVDDGGELEVRGTLRINYNSANYGGGIYKSRWGSVTTPGTGTIIYLGNTAVIAGPNIYNEP
ncbi:hypothetical protein Mlab_0136 [Methanocorpusculum labreanum Z]|uniref:Archaeal Type IV pilin N-terminal domain-containing protein n=1 Tax=Methanocorpusculum labreanum (strain ATCC 43576 / DSM 4855 / Z) TaxID=410358 RepID=A2SPQ7_METLZ|nr:type IV pilin N-terminal domain-containing protein [Methanocorpusculum labreanum]ABN06313.1 hypothetical protein Mlab_0136 [Methanocorpusculum labreanum Z]